MECEFWKEQGHCNETSEFPRVRRDCRKSCEICIACPDENRSTALPPTRAQVQQTNRN